MSYINEFPHTDYYGSDLRELINMYKKLVEDYDMIVSNYNKLIIDFNELEKNVSKTTSELVAKVNVEVNRAIKVMNDNMSTTKKLVSELESYVDKEMEINKQYVVNRIEEVSRLFKISISTIETQISALNDRLIHKYTVLESATRFEIAELKKYVDNTTIGKIRVINPVDEKLSDLQLALNNLHYNLKSWSLRAVDYDNLNLTAEEYDESEVSAWNYDYMAKWWLQEVKLLNDKKVTTYMFSPITGRSENIVDVVSSLYSLLNINAITADEYDQLSVNADIYDSKAISAYEYDWNAKLILI